MKRYLPDFFNYLFWIVPDKTQDADFENEIIQMVATNFFAEILTEDIIVHEIFTRLTCKEMLNFGCVEKRIHRLANDLLVMKDKIYLEKVFSPLDWQHFFSFGIEYDNEARNQLPNNIALLFKEYPHEFNNITWIPAGININSFGDLLKKHYPNNKKGYAWISETIQSEFGKICTLKGKWVTIKSGAIFNPLICQRFEGINFMKNPNVIEAVVSKFADWFKFKFYVYPNNCKIIFSLGKNRVSVEVCSLGISVSMAPLPSFSHLLVRRGVGGIRRPNQPFLY